MDSSKLLIQLKQFVRSSESASTSETVPKDRLNQTPRPAFISGPQVKRFYEATVGRKALEKSEGEQLRGVEVVKPQARNRKLRRLTKTTLNVNFFMRAVESGDLKEVARILEENEDAVNCRDQFGWTPLMCACRVGNSETVRLLLQRGADVTVRDKGGNNCDKLAQTGGNAKVLKLLAEFRRKPKDLELLEPPELDTESKKFPSFFCDVCNHQVENSSFKKHLTSTMHNFHASSNRRMPTVYGIPESNRGFQILIKSGWDKEVGLGPSGEGHKFPPKTILKQDRTGLGAKRYEPRVTHSLKAVNQERKQKRFKTNIKCAKQKEQRVERNLRRMLT